MNEIIRVSLAGMNLALNQDTYELLNSYLLKLENKYIGNPDGAEILSDIESRIVELVLEKQEQSALVSMEMVKDIIDRLGYPEFDEPNPIVEEPTPPKFNQHNRGKTAPKKMYRTQNGAKIAGVCSGLSRFSKINVVWIRLIFLLSLIFSPFAIITSSTTPLQFSLAAIIVYIVLWVVTPRITWEQAAQEIDENNSNTDENGTILSKKIYRSTKDGVIGGVCSGLSKTFKIDVVWIRILFVLMLATVIPFLSNHYLEESIWSFLLGVVLCYIILWVSIPKMKNSQQNNTEGQSTPPPYHTNSREQSSNSYSNQPTNNNEVFPKRLYRSSQGGLVGGVFSGLSKYFDINVAWFRLLYLLFLVPLMFIVFMMIIHNSNSDGTTASLLFNIGVILLYIIMWIAIPMAKSARQKLEMKGDGITAFSIGRQISDDATYIDAQSKESGLASVFAEMLKFIGKVIFIILKALLITTAFVVGLPILIFIVALLTMVIMSLAGATAFALPLMLSIIPLFIANDPNVFIPIDLLETTFLTIPLITIPLTATLIALIALICSWKRGIAWCMTIMIALWVISGSCLTYMVASTIDDMSIAKGMANDYYTYDGVKNYDHSYEFRSPAGKEYYFQNNKIEDTVTYERGTTYKGDTIVDAKLITTYVENEYNKGVYELDTICNENMTSIGNHSSIVVQNNYILGKILFALAIIATLSVLGMRITGKKRYFVLGLTIMITLWLFMCAYCLKELYFTSDISVVKSKLVTTKVVVGDSIVVDTITNYTQEESILH